MRLNRLDLNQLIVLEALLLERSVSRAAERVHLSQPAVSWGLRKLREFFDDPLLVQAGRRMLLTPFAESLLLPVQDVLGRMRALTELRPTEDPARMRREIRIVASDYTAQVLLAPTLQRVAQLAPGLEFRFGATQDRMHVDLESGETDLLLIAEAGKVSQHPFEPLFQDDYCCVVGQDNTRVKEGITQELLVELGHVEIEWGRIPIPFHSTEQIALAGLTRRIEVTVPNFLSVAVFLEGTERVALLPNGLARILAARWPLRLLELPIAMAPLVIGMQWSRHLDRDPVLRWFRGILQETAGSFK